MVLSISLIELFDHLQNSQARSQLSQKYISILKFVQIYIKNYYVYMFIHTNFLSLPCKDNINEQKNYSTSYSY